MAEIINEMMEDIIGTTAEDLAQTLGDAFFDAVAQGEDAMEAWHQKVNEIVRDILKRMMITQFLEPAIGKSSINTRRFGLMKRAISKASIRSRILLITLLMT